MTAGDAVAARARALVGVRFRPHGRGVAEGLDCVGLAAAAIGIADVRADYALRGGSIATVEREVVRVGLRRVGAVGKTGDLLVMSSGPGQLHLGIWTGAGLVHADGGLARVVERPGTPPWPVQSAWRVPEEN